MTHSERRTALRHPGPRNALTFFTELLTDHLAATTDGTHERYLRMIDSTLVDAVEEAVFAADLPPYSEWLADQDADEAADRDVAA